MNAPAVQEPTTEPLSRFLNATQLEVFQEITIGYFAKLAPREPAPTIGEPYVQFEDPVLLDYTSLVAITGSYHGVIYITAPTTTIEQLLQLQGEPEITDKTRTDMCREFSNVLAGNASHAFGADWTISVPRSLLPGVPHDLKLPPSTFIMPVVWHDQRFFLVIGLGEPTDSST